MAGSRKINFKSKSDRSLLELTAQAVNDIREEDLPDIKTQLKELNGSVRNHEGRIIKLETKQKLKNPGNSSNDQVSFQNKLLDKLTSIGGGWLAAILTIAALVAIFYHVGCIFHWWG